MESRILATTATVTAVAWEPTGKKVNLTPVAITGLIVALFLMCTLWTGIYSMIGVRGPADFQTKEFLFGREM